MNRRQFLLASAAAAIVPALPLRAPAVAAGPALPWTMECGTIWFGRASVTRYALGDAVLVLVESVTYSVPDSVECRQWQTLRSAEGERTFEASLDPLDTATIWDHP